MSQLNAWRNRYVSVAMKGQGVMAPLPLPLSCSLLNFLNFFLLYFVSTQRGWDISDIFRTTDLGRHFGTASMLFFRRESKLPVKLHAGIFISRIPIFEKNTLSKLTMRLTTLSLLSLVTVVVSAENPSLRVANAMTADVVGDSPCNNIHDQQKCLLSKDVDGSGCIWCECQAVPPVCVTEDQSSSLPPGVFQCISPGLFQFVDDRTHHLTVLDQGNSDMCDSTSKSLSGYMDIKGSKYDQNGENKHLFFWMFEKRNQDENLSAEEIPFVVWLTGGPGCSSTLALLTENGPCSVNEDGATTTPNPFSWTEAAHVLWLDQPAGVGFSYGAENDSGEEMVSEDAYFFLQAFFQTYPEYAKSPLFIIGESYAGVSIIPM